MDNEEFQQKTLKAIRELNSENQQLMNRLFACECILSSLIQFLDYQTLDPLAEEYEEHIDRLAAQFPPKFQQPERWTPFLDAIAARKKSIQMQRQMNEKKPGKS